jgi:hypothetical protein
VLFCSASLPRIPEIERREAAIARTTNKKIG